MWHEDCSKGSHRQGEHRDIFAEMRARAHRCGDGFSGSKIATAIGNEMMARAPVMNGIQTAYEIRRTAPSIKIVFFTVHDSPNV